MRGYQAFLAAAMLLFGLQSAAHAQIGSARAVQNQVNGVIGGSSRPLASGSQVYSNEIIRTGTGSVGEFVFLDNTKLSVGPTAEVKLDRFIYNPGGSSSVVLNATRGAFRFITGEADKNAYAIRTPYGTIGVRGTWLEFDLLNGLTLKVTEGLGLLTLPNGQVITVEPGMMVKVSPNGVVTGPMPAPTTILDFASLDVPETGTVYANVPAALGVLAVGALVPFLLKKKDDKPISP